MTEQSTHAHTTRLRTVDPSPREDAHGGDKARGRRGLHEWGESTHHTAETNRPDTRELRIVVV